MAITPLEMNMNISRLIIESRPRNRMLAVANRVAVATLFPFLFIVALEVYVKNLICIGSINLGITLINKVRSMGAPKAPPSPPPVRRLQAAPEPPPTPALPAAPPEAPVAPPPPESPVERLETPPPESLVKPTEPPAEPSKPPTPTRAAPPSRFSSLWSRIYELGINSGLYTGN